MGYVRVPYHGPPVIGAQDQDDFVRDLRTILTGSGSTAVAQSPNTPSGSVRGVPPVVTLDEIKAHCRIEADQTADDTLLLQYEMAARLHTANFLRHEIDASVGENIKVAILMLIAHWYRQRESVAAVQLTEVPLAYMALLWPERNLADAFGAPSPPVIPLPPAADLQPNIISGYLDIPDSSTIGSIPIWPATLLLADTSAEIPAGDFVVNIRIVLNIGATNQDNVITVRCNARQQSINLGKTVGPADVLSEVFAFASVPDPAGGAFPIHIEVGANVAVPIYGSGGASALWDSYVTWTITRA